jgi:predicted nucleic acid-binding protein
LIVDASAIIDLGLRNEPKASWVERHTFSEAELHAPHLLDVEVASGLRRLHLAGQISQRRAREVLELLRDLSIERYPHVQLLERIWQLAPGLSAYDAAYVALAEALAAPLLTTDDALARSSGHSAEIMCFSG